jgi:hypothetical protein
MKPTSLLPAVVGCTWLFTVSLFAGQFKRITIDGAFDDWLGVPASKIDDADAEGKFDFKEVAIANDDDYLYVRVRLHSPSSYSGFNHQVLVDTDADGSTGHAWGGVGSELFIENGASYQQKNGAFNEGSGSNLGWSVSPSGSSTQFEMRLSRASLDTEGLAFFGGDDVEVSVLAQTLDWALADSVESILYTFVTQPEIFQGTKTLTNLADTLWIYQEVSDPEQDWLLPDFLPEDDTWQGGDGFFSFGFDDGVYPVNASVPLATGRTTYYFRTWPFQWDHAAEGVALLADAHISDGAVIYLNGEEVRRIRMPEGAIDGSTPALASVATPGQVETFSLPAAALINGENLLMVEMHQALDSMDSLAFGLTLTANDSVPPSFEEPGKPLDREVVEGEGTLFELGPLAGTEPYLFQWYKDDAAIPEATGVRLEIPIVLQEDGGTYSVEVSNGSGSVRSRDISLTTTALPVSFPNDAQPADQLLTQGEALTLSIEVEGSPNFTYQWFKDDVAIDLATEATLTIDAAAVEDTGDYHVTVNNRLNSLNSRTASIVVQSDANAPTIDAIRAGSGSVIITFSEILSSNSATDVAHYTIPGIDVESATLADDLRTVTLETAAMTFAQEYALTVNGIDDRFGNSVKSAAPFRASILIDGDFGDWTGIDPVATDALESEGYEFHQFWAANDDEFLYLRFSFHENIGQLPVDYFYQIFIDGDKDPSSGFSVSTIGSSMMIENGSAWMQVGGEFNEGSVPNVDFQLAPTEASAEFECRISLSSSKDDVPLLTADALGISFNLITTSWEAIESGPAEGIVYTLVNRPPLTESEPPGEAAPLAIRQVGGQIEIIWDGTLLETSESLLPNSWVPVPDAPKPFLANPDDATRFYRGTD